MMLIIILLLLLLIMLIHDVNYNITIIVINYVNTGLYSIVFL
jgi:hypothetical protein